MIVVKQKQLEEIVAMVAHHKRVMLVGCNTCAAVALAGGDREVETMAQALRLAVKRRGGSTEFACGMLQRQCEPEFTDELIGSETDAILSLGCGAGVALLATRAGMPVYPALDTMFIGAATGMAAWQAECSACGKCVLGQTAGICPITRCAKGILNGPCGGVDEGRCELGDRDCAWVLIHERLEAIGQADRFGDELAPKDFSVTTSSATWDMAAAAEAADEAAAKAAADKAEAEAAATSAATTGAAAPKEAE